MNPFEVWWAWYVWWMMTLYQPDEVRALRNLQNSNVIRLDRIEKALREEGIGGHSRILSLLTKGAGRKCTTVQRDGVPSA
jgi:hypothetical protein